MSEEQEYTPLSKQAAKLSWACPVILILATAVGHQIASPLVFDLVCLLLIVVGFAAGVIALFGIPAHGTSGILFPAIIGIIINGLLLFIFVTNFFAARERALQQNSRLENAPIAIRLNVATNETSAVPLIWG